MVWKHDRVSGADGKPRCGWVTNDPLFGLAIMFGLGGIYAEVLRDVSFRMLPITRRLVTNSIMPPSVSFCSGAISGHDDEKYHDVEVSEAPM